jgi:hypothetical protein
MYGLFAKGLNFSLSHSNTRGKHILDDFFCVNTYLPNENVEWQCSDFTDSFTKPADVLEGKDGLQELDNDSSHVDVDQSNDVKGGP